MYGHTLKKYTLGLLTWHRFTALSASMTHSTTSITTKITSRITRPE
jgi:hypothetical protein